MKIAGRISSPIGDLTLVEEDDAITELWMNTQPGWASECSDRLTPLLGRAKVQLDEYFAGERQSFDLPLRPNGTEFQRRVWQALLDIPYGSTQTYIGLARALGDEKATRAVGLANGKNPISILIPCHRVIGANGHLTGYGGGIERKRFLLDLESSLFAPQLSRDPL